MESLTSPTARNGSGHEVGRGREWAAFGAFCIFAIVVRFPLFFQDVIDWDESVFLLMGQSIAKGHLPYTVIWDNKPPVGFLFFAAIEALIPRSLLAVRLCGALWVALSSFLVYRLALGLMPRAEALLAGMVFIIAASLLAGSGQAVMMEHIANPLVLAALLIAMKRAPRAADCFLFGALFALAVFVRTNLAFAAVIVGSVFVLWRFSEGWVAAARAAIWVAAGAATAVLLVTLPFLLAGQWEGFVTSVIKVPLAYSANGLGYGETALRLLSLILPVEGRDLADPHLLAVSTFWLLGLAGFLLVCLRLPFRKDKHALGLILVAAVATVAATLASRQPYGHYLIQIMPVWAICFAYVLSDARVLKGWTSMLTFGIAGLAAVALVFPSYSAFAGRMTAGKAWYAGPNFALAKEIGPQIGAEDTIFVSRHILLYWLLGKTPPTPIAAFPSNMFREEEIVKPLYGSTATTEKLLADVMDRCPYVVVLSGDDRDYLRVPSFVSRIEQDYASLFRLGKTFVLGRKVRAADDTARCGA